MFVHSFYKHVNIVLKLINSFDAKRVQKWMGINSLKATKQSQLSQQIIFDGQLGLRGLYLELALLSKWTGYIFDKIIEFWQKPTENNVFYIIMSTPLKEGSVICNRVWFQVILAKWIKLQGFLKKTKQSSNLAAKCWWKVALCFKKV